MKILLSPAKSLDETPCAKTLKTGILFEEKTKQLVQALKQLSQNDLGQMMKLSDNLSALNYQRYQDWNLKNVMACLYLFKGEVFKGLEHRGKWVEKHQTILQENVRILSGLYGMLRPFDGIFPYRLEMGTKFGVSSSKNLYEFWQSTVTQKLKNETKSDELIVNLASAEYAKAVDFKALNRNVITCQFKDYKNGAYKIVMMYAKFSRGAMAKFLCEHNIEKIDDIKAFNVNGYGFNAQLSSENEFVFTRKINE